MATSKVAQTEKKTLTVSSILADLDNGLDRDQIKAKYELTRTDLMRLFQHPQLKGRKVKTAPSFILEDDVTGTDKEFKPKAKEAAEADEVAEVVTETAPKAAKGTW